MTRADLACPARRTHRTRAEHRPAADHRDRRPARESPGDIVSAHPSRFRPNPYTPSSARARTIRYRSPSATGAPSVVSGTVLVPDDGRTGTRPLVGYAVGTVGLAPKGAPSAGFPTGTAVEGNLFIQALLLGWAVTVTDPLEQPDWQRRLRADQLGTRAPDAPVHLYQARADELVPYPVAARPRREWCGAGGTVWWRELPLTGHVEGAIAGSPLAMRWMAQRFAGGPAETNC